MNNSSKITDAINYVFAALQEDFRPLVSASLFLQRFDYFIMLLAVILLALSLFASTEILGLIAALIVLFTILKMSFIRGQNIEITFSTILLLAYLAICCISIFFSDYTILSVAGYKKTLIYISFYFSMVQFFRFNKNKINSMIFIVASIVALEALFAILQSFGPMDVSSAWQDTSYVNPEDTLSRVFGTLGNPNLLCAYLMVGLASINIVAFNAFLGKHKKTFSISILFLIVTLIAIFLTGCRGGYIGLFAMFLVAAFLINSVLKMHFSEKVKKAWKKICMCFVSLGMLAIVFSPAILKRILSIFIMRKDSSTSFRMNVYQSCWQMFFDNWFTGIGVGNETFRNVYGLYMVSGYHALSAYSIYLEILVESGIFALIFFISYFATLLKYSMIALKNNLSIEQKSIIISIVVMVIGVFVHGFFDTVFFRPQVQFLFWLNMAILVVLVECDNANTRQSTLLKICVQVKDKIKKGIKRLKTNG